MSRLVNSWAYSLVTAAAVAGLVVTHEGRIRDGWRLELKQWDKTQSTAKSPQIGPPTPYNLHLIRVQKYIDGYTLRNGGPPDKKTESEFAEAAIIAENISKLKNV